MGAGSQYERELRKVLAGSPDGVRAVIRSCTEEERALARLVIERPFLVVRAAGSGIEGSGDLLALRGDICFPIEVKTSKHSTLYLNGRLRSQYEALEQIGQRCGLMPLYAYRLKGTRGDSWRIFRIDTGQLEGRLSILARRIPACPLTSNGRPHLIWEEGLPLHRFLALVCRQRDSSKNGLSGLQNRNSQEEMKIPMQDEQISEPMKEWVRGFIH